jgi:hypothetical protein
MINTISMANARTQNQRIPAAGKNQVGFAGLWGKTFRDERLVYGGDVLEYTTNLYYYPFKDEAPEAIEQIIKKNNSSTSSGGGFITTYYDTSCSQCTTLPFTEKEFDAFTNNPESMDETKRKLINEATKDLYVDADNTVLVHDKLKSLNIAAKPAAVKTATETKVVKPLTIEERLGNLEESMKGIKEGLAKFMDDIAPVIKKLGKDSKK